jgi:hypothetical protein
MAFSSRIGDNLVQSAGTISAPVGAIAQVHHADKAAFEEMFTGQLTDMAVIETDPRVWNAIPVSIHLNDLDPALMKGFEGYPPAGHHDQPVTDGLAEPPQI